MNLPYTIIIQWSSEDKCYLVHLPEFPTQKYHTHGDTYEEAVKNAQEVAKWLEKRDDTTSVPTDKRRLLSVSK